MRISPPLLILAALISAALPGPAMRGEADAGSDYDRKVESLAREIGSLMPNRSLVERVERKLDSVRSDPERGAAATRAALDRLDLIPLRVPGLRYRSNPETGADLRAVERWLGRPVGLVATGELAPVEENVPIVAQAIRDAARDHRRVLLLSASKGSAEVRAALEGDPSLGASVAAWIDLVGVLEGTPLTDPGTESGRAVRPFLPDLTARSLSRAVRARAAAPERFPSATRAVHVAAFPRAADVSDAARRGFEHLRALGLNDGYVLLDAYRRAPGRVLIVHGADHFLRVESLGPRILALALVLLAELEAEASAPPVTRR